MNIFCWLVSLTEHQVHLMREINNTPAISLNIVVSTHELPIRVKQGWIKPEIGDLNVKKISGLDLFIKGIRLIQDNPNAIHLFSGLWGNRYLFLILLYAALKKRQIGILVEPYSDTIDGYLSDEWIFFSWVYVKLRPIAYGIAGRFLSSRIKHIFAISPKAVIQFRKARFLEKNIHPFGYFVPFQQNKKTDEVAQASSALRLIFIGALIFRKGINVVREIAKVCYEKNIPILIDVYGPGDPTLLKDISPNLNYCGSIAFGKVHDVMRGYDLLIVPSKFDGWGVVVNEAIQCGLPVLASSNVGAAALVLQSGAGAVFNLNNLLALIRLLEKLAQDRETITNWRNKAKKFSLELTPEIAAKYMLECIDSYTGTKNKPICPWYSVQDYEILISGNVKKRVTFFHRKPASINYSVESAFKAIREAMPADIEATVAESRYYSKGFFPRLYNIFEAAFRQGEINHITGDVHFLSYLLRRNKTLLTILDFVFVVNNQGLKKKILLFFWGTVPVRRVRLISVISESTKLQALEYLKCNPNMVRVVPVPISSVFTRYDKEFNTDKPALLQVGTSDNKNIIRLADALRGVSCELEIIGKLSCEQLDSLKRNNIDYRNSFGLSEDEVLDRYRQADLVTFVSTYEGFGMPIVEANAVGRPVITSNVFSMPEVAGNAACLVDPFNINDIRNGILRIISDKVYRNNLVFNGFINAKRFEASVVAEQYAKIYSEISK